MTRARLVAALLCVAACALTGVARPCFAGTPYDLEGTRDVDRGASRDGRAEHLPDVEGMPRAAGDATTDADPAAAAELARALANLDAPEWIDRLTGLYALQRMGGPAIAPVVPRVVLLLTDENGSVREESAECLFRAGTPAVPALVDALSSRDDDTRALAARTLGRIGLGAHDAVPVLEGLRDDPSPDVADQVAFALPMIAPQGPRDWLWKLGFEIEDEPWGIPILFGVFVALVTGKVGWNLWRTARRREAPVPGDAEELWRSASCRADTGSQSNLPPQPASPRPRERDDGRSRGDDADDEEDEDADDDLDDDTDTGPRDDAADRRAGRFDGGRITVERRGREDDPLQPTQGTPHTVMGLIAMSVAAFIAFLGTWKDVADERHGVWHFAGLFFLFGWLFFKIGLKGELDARRARARRDQNQESWLKDRAWDRTGTGPIKAERFAPSLAALALWVGFLLPFHTVWALPWSYWGVWIVLGIFDLIGVAILVAAVRRLWWTLRAGRCRLRFEGVPVRPGGTFSARFETSRALGEGSNVEATLRCLRDPAENRVIGEEAAADAEEIWAEKRSFRVHDRPEGGSWVQLSFAVPLKARGTDSYAARPVRWVVAVSMPIVGPDFRTTFPVPIYR